MCSTSMSTETCFCLVAMFLVFAGNWYYSTRLFTQLFACSTTTATEVSFCWSRLPRQYAFSSRVCVESFLCLSERSWNDAFVRPRCPGNMLLFVQSAMESRSRLASVPRNHVLYRQAVHWNIPLLDQNANVPCFCSFGTLRHPVCCARMLLESLFLLLVEAMQAVHGNT